MPVNNISFPAGKIGGKAAKLTFTEFGKDKQYEGQYEKERRHGCQYGDQKKNNKCSNGNDDQLAIPGGKIQLPIPSAAGRGER